MRIVIVPSETGFPVMQANKSRRHNIAPMAMGGLARIALAYAEDKGIDVEPILKVSSLSRKQISDPQKRLEVRHQIKFVEVVAETVGDDFLGFHLSRDYDLRLMGLLYYVVASSDRLGDALL